MMNRIIETADGFDIEIDGERHGSWRSRAEASAGLFVEEQRARRRKAEPPIPPAQTDVLHEACMLMRRLLDYVDTTWGPAEGVPEPVEARDAAAFLERMGRANQRAERQKRGQH